MPMGLLASLKVTHKGHQDSSTSVIKVRRRGDGFCGDTKSTEPGTSQKLSDDGTNSTCLNSEIYSDYSDICLSKSDDAVDFRSGDFPQKNCNIDDTFHVPNIVSIPVPFRDEYYEVRQELSVQNSHRSIQNDFRDDVPTSVTSPSNLSSSMVSDCSNPDMEEISLISTGSFKSATKALPLNEIRRTASETSKLYVHLYHNKLPHIKEETSESGDDHEDECYRDQSGSEYAFDENEMKERWIYSLKLMQHLGVRTSFPTIISSMRSEMIKVRTAENTRDDVEW
jgi:hypothetical protein